jgi:hypothetical protein
MHLHPLAATHRTVEGESETARRMMEASSLLLASLNPEQQGRILFPATSEERMNWHYIPRSRQGLPLAEMDGSQQKFAYLLLSTGLSHDGYGKAMKIMGLETTLKHLEGPVRRFERDPDLYFFSFFGRPSGQSPWGWRIEGHHLSLNFLIVKGQEIAPTPSFFGANPAEVPGGYPLSGLRILSGEEDLARNLFVSLDEGQRRRVLMAPEAPPDILTTAEKRLRPDAPLGMAASGMREDQEQILMALILEYVNRMPPNLAGRQLNQIEKDGRSYIHFAWAGSAKVREPHYYRVHGPGFFVEYDNTQNNANHIHCVWRDLRNDWGEDLLQDHYLRSHAENR